MKCHFFPENDISYTPYLQRPIPNLLKKHLQNSLFTALPPPYEWSLLVSLSN